MTGRDEYYNRAKQEGYRARSAYKLKQLDRTADLIAPGDAVVDLGAAPGGWLQVAAEAVGDHGKVVGVDRQRIDELDSHVVETVRGDMTDERTRDRLREAVGAAGEGEYPVDVVVSDLAPNMTGEYELDHARSAHLARQAFETALELLVPGGDFVVKVFEGRDLDDFRDDVAAEFEYVRTVSPDASREESSEVYVVGKGRIDAPVTEDQRLTVEVTDVGDEGDGVADVDGYTVFVPGAEAGETVEVAVTDVKPRFAFAEQVED
ncbi:MAG: 23S rRNA (uridine(2552)-2'-O)-methyltransferase [Halolamina sp.]